MATYAPLEIPEDGKLAQNVTHFARALRRAGLPIGPGRVLDAIRAVEVVGFSERVDFYWTLHACFVSRPEERVIYEQVFRLFWRDPKYLDHMMSLLLPSIQGLQEDRAASAAEKRAAEALLDGVERDLPAGDDDSADGDGEIDIDASATMSHEERLKTLDFEQMSVAEVAQAKRMLARLSLPVKPLVTRRSRASTTGAQVDMRRTLRASLRHGGEITQLSMKTPRLRWPNLVVLCDISGSMSQYSRLVLHFIHAVANRQGQGWARVHGFTFGTRLTNITRHLKNRDVDAALRAAGAEAQDWSGGTRIGSCLADFNRDWSRRVLGQGAVVLLITDGLDRDDSGQLARQMERLHLSCRRLIWLNPLLRWDGFAPKAQGIRAMLPHCDAFRAGHSVASLEALAAVISDPGDGGEKQRLLRMMSGT
ncbi:MAG: VWA domain-containing protein [Pseudotabrizicola sp.]|uniref:vWA domain-containing protein n=1 Tax=Pseudotabrizicola sp. TaxID=2939647 RepID=UPI00271632CF|nr:VWA domain-containing protein [Pseudotabrizicola sp.]MDO8882998.1 VWA domain-containing protein [Pseudotabrizicola sp.]MDP2079796.1 VWA domain-containing protein [Pseudotabrizicola sp.]MDZ7574797.1 VWA domain-containing protein [Pseudotabrizicola sp.]